MTRKGPARDVEKERFWRNAVRGQEGSGQSIRAYCSGNGLTEASFYGRVAMADGGDSVPLALPVPSVR